ncbi:MAG: hypothetical protein P4M00_04480 [Azospirillaceae bacterium]|nr:hypothetical protein [Azospirillaceae bacterium]
MIKLLKAARQEEIGFGFGVTAAGGLMVAEKGRSGDQMVAVTRKLPGVTQSCGGLAHYDGTVLTLVCDRPVSNLGRLAEAWGKTHKFSFKVQVTSHRAAQEGEADAQTEEDREDPFAFEQVKARLAKAKSTAMLFAFGVGATPGTDLLGLHPRRGGAALVRPLRARNGATKFAWGTVALDGSTAIFTCEEDPFGGMKRRLRALFAEWKLPLKVTVIGPSGELDEPDLDNAAGSRPTAGPATDTDGASTVTVLRQQLAALLPALKQLFAAAPDQAEAIRRDYAACQAALKAGSIADARPLIDGLAARLDPSTGRAGTGGVEELRTELDGMLPALKELARDPAVTDQIRALWRTADAALKSGDRATAGPAIASLRQRLAVPKAAAGDDAALAQGWSMARDSAATELRGLEGAILADYGDLPEAGALRSAVRKFDGILATLGPDLADLLAEAGARPASERQALHLQAQDLTARYRSFLDSDPVLAELDDNPFVAVSVKRRFSATLDAIDTALADAVPG